MSYDSNPLRHQSHHEEAQLLGEILGCECDDNRNTPVHVHLDTQMHKYTCTLTCTYENLLYTYLLTYLHGRIYIYIYKHTHARARMCTFKLTANLCSNTCIYTSLFLLSLSVFLLYSFIYSWQYIYMHIFIICSQLFIIHRCSNTVTLIFIWIFTMNNTREQCGIVWNEDSIARLLVQGECNNFSIFDDLLATRGRD